MFLAGGPGKPIEFGDSIHNAVDSVSSPARVRAGFAYATENGISALCENDSGEDWRDHASMEWLIGVDQGITEPDALRELSARGDSEVRVLVPGGDLTPEALYRRPRFHAKVAMVESTGRDDEAHIVSSSANLTGSALRDSPTNYEVGLSQSTESGLTNDDIDSFDEWWQSAWERSQVVTEDFLDEYESIRGGFFDRNPDIQEFESSETVNHASEADHLWIETWEMTGGSGNQIELSTELSPFIDSEGGQITIILNGTTHTDCSVSPRVTDPPFGQEITPVYLPTGRDYRNSFLHLERLSASPTGQPRYELTVADPGDDVVDEWKRRSRENGVKSQTGAGREYGFY